MFVCGTGKNTLVTQWTLSDHKRIIRENLAKKIKPKDNLVLSLTNCTLKVTKKRLSDHFTSWQIISGDCVLVRWSLIKQIIKDVNLLYNQRKLGLQLYWFQMPVAQQTLNKSDFLRGMMKSVTRSLHLRNFRLFRGLEYSNENNVKYRHSK